MKPKKGKWKMKLRMVLPLLIFLIAASAIQPAIAQPPSGMVSYWRFDEGSGTTAYDSVGANDGTIYGATWTTGKVGGALSFDGVDDYVDCGNDASLSPEKFTFEAWIKTSDEGWNTIFANDNDWDEGYRFYKNAYEGIRLAGGFGGIWSRDDGGNGLINLGEWNHLAVTYDGATVRFYINGDPVGSVNKLPIKPSTHNFWIGKRDISHSVNPNWFNGLIDEVAIYNRTLTAEEIQQHYQNGLMGLGYVEVPLTVETWMTDSDFNNITSFRAVFTPYRKTGDYKLTATNPGQFYFNILFNNTGTTTRNIDITYNIDSNFTTKGAKPIHVYTDINRIVDITADCTFSDNTITAYDVDPNAIIYVTIHLDYALKSTTWTRSQVDAWYSEHTFSATADAVVSTVTITDPESIVPPIPSYLIFLAAILPTIMLCLGIFIAPLKYALPSTKGRK